MDNQKIGKLIARLRNQNGLTQQELGDKIGVGFRAVSKWERGLNLPDIANMTELSKIFGISLDELMTGELKEKEEPKSTKKLSPKIIVTITIALILITLTLSICVYRNNKEYTYNIISADKDKYYIEGQLSMKGKKLSIIVNKLDILDDIINSIKIINYEYEITIDKEFIFGYGYTPTTYLLETEESIEYFNKTFTVNYNGDTNLTKDDILKNNIIINITYLDKNKKEIIQNIKLDLLAIKK